MRDRVHVRFSGSFWLNCAAAKYYTEQINQRKLNEIAFYATTTATEKKSSKNKMKPYVRFMFYNIGFDSVMFSFRSFFPSFIAVES